ncbi:ABC transporter ATP-binding protein [Tenuibacillus multivorans]|uniref:ABC-2 type transport system ATP-binding protein n=1 Tax=Tenuibacillus multivorans TaxID=237069 RepID=A0A1H0DXN5_9BACI|nr:ABC transporter ATP-binding protein [Tenuibacillus multivorans]GEL76735.1 bacitracin ABC transporter ATP-binding protein [Tenuibacillus multivorans]SDN74944.1 ABC-2 type transport system ATP-binding protein [Tenuibacillus multivorans]
MEEIIKVDSLTKFFANEEALDGLDLSIHSREIFGFLGPSGAGKTTTIKLLTGQLLPTSGSATVFGVPVKEVNSPQHLKKIGVMSDNSGLYERLSIYENLKLYCELYQVTTDRIREVLEMVNLIGEEKKMISKLSKGMRQRVVLARTFLHKPNLLFLDEPTAALDPVNSEQIHRGLRELNQNGTTIFLTTHDMREAETLCDRIAFLNNGEVQLMGPPKELQRQYSNGNIRLELKNGHEVEVQNNKEGAQKVHEWMSSGELVRIQSHEPTLGEIFVDITGRKLI